MDGITESSSAAREFERRVSQGSQVKVVDHHMNLFVSASCSIRRQSIRQEYYFMIVPNYFDRKKD